jgi:hypothetical protein
MQQQRSPNNEGLNTTQRSNLNAPGEKKKTPLAIGPRATGPRTSAGKERSKHNAIKHGIFANAMLLRNESRTEFDSMLNRFRNDLQPQGMLEELLVEKLAVISWRYRRLLYAEAAEIEMRAEFVEWDERERQEKEAGDDFRGPGGFASPDRKDWGLMQKMENPIILERCLNLLDQLRSTIEARGFERKLDAEILMGLYGRHERWAETLLDSYVKWCRTAEYSDHEREEGGFASAEQCKRIFLETVRTEIKHLNRYEKERASIESERIKLESQRLNIPEAPQLDRLLRYETTLERAFDRAQIQLERLQRMRRSEAASPQLNVNLSSS